MFHFHPIKPTRHVTFTLTEQERLVDLTPHIVESVNISNNFAYCKPQLRLGWSEEVDATKSLLDNIDRRTQNRARELAYSLEFVKPPNNNPRARNLIKKKLLSRAYIKFAELAMYYGLDKLLASQSGPITTASCAEGPGGFIQWIAGARASNADHTADQYYGITLKTDKEHTDFVSDFLNKHPNIHISYGQDGTGNLYKSSNIIYFAEEELQGKKAILTTGDGGFDFEGKEQFQEQVMHKLLFAQCLTALATQAQGGTFVCKCFDIYTELTAKILYMLGCFYETVDLYKPVTSRPASSERYIVANNFRGVPASFMTMAYTTLDNWGDETPYCDIFQFQLPNHFVSALADYNALCASVQIDAIKDMVWYATNKISRDEVNRLLDRNYELSELYVRALDPTLLLPEMPAMLQPDDKYNPPVIITDEVCGDKTIHVIRDDKLPAGSKQRALKYLLQDAPKTTVFGYVGPSWAVGQYALAYMANEFGYRVRLFLVGDPNPISKRSEALPNTEVTYVQGRMRDAYALSDPWKRHPDHKLIEFGLDAPGFAEALQHAIRAAWGNLKEPARMWMAVGSGTLLKALYNVFPNTHFDVVKVSPLKVETAEMRDTRRVTVHDYVSEYGVRFTRPALQLPTTFESIANYDAKAWHMMCDKGKTGDYFWNVAGMPLTAALEKPIVTAAKPEIKSETVFTFSELENLVVSDVKAYIERDPETGMDYFNLPRNAMANIKRNDIDKLISGVIDLYKANKIAFPWKRLFISMADADAMMENLRYYDPRMTMEVVQQPRKPANIQFRTRLVNTDCYRTIMYWDRDYETMDVIVDVFQEKARLQAKRKDAELSPLEAWYKPGTLKRVLQLAINEFGELTPYSMREAMWRAHIKEATQFKPSLMVSVIRLFDAKSVLDFSAGWGERLTGAIATGARYLGFDPNTDLKAGHDAIIDRYGNGNHEKYKIEYIGFQDAVVQPETVDLVFTSPPYWDFEVYSDKPGQSIQLYPNLSDWLVKFLFASIVKAWSALRVGGHMVLHISDLPKMEICEPMCLLIAAYIPDAKYNGIICSYGGSEKARPMWVWEKDAVSTLETERKIAANALQRYYPDIANIYEMSAPVSAPVSASIDAINSIRNKIGKADYSILLKTIPPQVDRAFVAANTKLFMIDFPFLNRASILKRLLLPIMRSPALLKRIGITVEEQNSITNMVSDMTDMYVINGPVYSKQHGKLHQVYGIFVNMGILNNIHKSYTMVKNQPGNAGEMMLYNGVFNMIYLMVQSALRQTPQGLLSEVVIELQPILRHLNTAYKDDAYVTLFVDYLFLCLNEMPLSSSVFVHFVGDIPYNNVANRMGKYGLMVRIYDSYIEIVTPYTKIIYSNDMPFIETQYTYQTLYHNENALPDKLFTSDSGVVSGILNSILLCHDLLDISTWEGVPDIFVEPSEGYDDGAIHEPHQQYPDCRMHGCKKGTPMKYCCPSGTPAEGFCRLDPPSCYLTGFAEPSIRVRDLDANDWNRINEYKAQLTKKVVDPSKEELQKMWPVSTKKQSKEELQKMWPVSTKKQSKEELQKMWPVSTKEQSKEELQKMWPVSTKKQSKEELQKMWPVSTKKQPRGDSHVKNESVDRSMVVQLKVDNRRLASPKSYDPNNICSIDDLMATAMNRLFKSPLRMEQEFEHFITIWKENMNSPAIRELIVWWDSYDNRINIPQVVKCIANKIRKNVDDVANNIVTKTRQQYRTLYATLTVIMRRLKSANFNALREYIVNYVNVYLSKDDKFSAYAPLDPEHPKFVDRQLSMKRINWLTTMRETYGKEINEQTRLFIKYVRFRNAGEVMNQLLDPGASYNDESYLQFYGTPIHGKPGKFKSMGALESFDFFEKDKELATGSMLLHVVDVHQKYMRSESSKISIELERKIDPNNETGMHEETFAKNRSASRTFDIMVYPNDTIERVKQRIQHVGGNYNIILEDLEGGILEDFATVAEMGLREGDYIVFRRIRPSRFCVIGPVYHSEHLESTVMVTKSYGIFFQSDFELMFDAISNVVPAGIESQIFLEVQYVDEKLIINLENLMNRGIIENIHIILIPQGPIENVVLPLNIEIYDPEKQYPELEYTFRQFSWTGVDEALNTNYSSILNNPKFATMLFEPSRWIFL